MALERKISVSKAKIDIRWSFRQARFNNGDSLKSL
jgi:hypothetical protein